MAKEHLSGFLSGPRGLKKIFQNNKTLRRMLGKKEKDYVLKSLMEHREGGGITARPGGQGYQSELEKAAGKWRRNLKDPIDSTEAKIIKRELEKSLSGNEAKASKLNQLRASLNSETDRKYQPRAPEKHSRDSLDGGEGNDYLDSLRGPDEFSDNDSRLGESPHRFE